GPLRPSFREHPGTAPPCDVTRPDLLDRQLLRGGCDRLRIRRNPVDHQAWLTFDTGELRGADRSAQLAVPGAAACEETESRAAGQFQFGPDDRMDPVHLCRLDQLDRSVQTVGITEAECGEAEPGRGLDHDPG